MKSIFYILLIWIYFSNLNYGQSHLFDSGEIEILAIAPLDTVSAVSKKMNATLDLRCKDISFECEIESLLFAHQGILTNLSSTIIDTKRHPFISFCGKFKKVKSDKEIKPKRIQINGVLSLNGIDNKLYVEAILLKVKEKINIKFTTTIDLNDHDVVIPTILRDALSNEIIVSFDIDMLSSSKDKDSEE